MLSFIHSLGSLLRGKNGRRTKIVSFEKPVTLWKYPSQCPKSSLTAVKHYNNVSYRKSRNKWFPLTLLLTISRLWGSFLPLWGLLCRGIKKSMLVRPVWVSLSVSPAPNGRPAPNIHTWDSHMPYGYFPECSKITKLSHTKKRFLAQNALAELHTRSKNVAKIMPNRDST